MDNVAERARNAGGPNGIVVRLTARQLYEQAKLTHAQAFSDFGKKPMLINIDLQCSYTCVGEFVTAYETDPQQLEYVKHAFCLAREKGLPITWT